jgi:hypothetical protein
MEPMDDAIDIGPMITTKLVWDMVDHPYVTRFLPELGLTPPSDEGLESADRESHVRQLTMAPVAPLFNKLAEMAAGIYTVWKLGADSDGDPEGPDRSVFTDQNTELLQTAGVSIIAQLIEMEMLTYGPELVRLINDVI